LAKFNSYLIKTALKLWECSG